MRQYFLRELVKCDRSAVASVLQIRNKDFIRNAMYSDHLISDCEHLRWVDGLRNDPHQLVWAVLRSDGQPGGLVSFSQISRRHLRADWAFYLDESERGGVGSALEVFMLDYAFSELGLEKLNCEVLETNPGVVAMHRKFGFLEEGFRRSHAIKNGLAVGAHFMGITKTDWLSHRCQMAEKIAGLKDRINIAMACDG